MAKNAILHEGELNLNGLTIPCYVLEDGTRVIAARAMQNALKVTSNHYKNEESKPGGDLARFLSSKWFKSLITNEEELEHYKPITCYKGGQKINGYEATTLVDLCNIMLEARKNQQLNTDRQIIVADQSEILIRAFAKVGIIALVDEATGYQYDREKDALQVIFKAFVNDELLKWQKKFPDAFYFEIFRLNGWPYTVSSINKRPGVIGTWTNELIYNQLPKGVLDELKKKTPKSDAGNYTARFFQSLTPDIGHPALTAQIYKVLGIMNISSSWSEFKNNFNRMVDRNNGQMELDFENIEKNIPETLQKPKRELSEFNKTLKIGLEWNPKGDKE